MSPSYSRLQPVRTPWRCRTQRLHSSHHCSRSLRRSLPHKTRACLSEDNVCLTTFEEKYEISPLAFAVSVSFLPSASSVSGLERQPQLGMGRPSGPVGQGASRPGGPGAPWSPFRPRFPFLPASPWAHPQSKNPASAPRSPPGPECRAPPAPLFAPAGRPCPGCRPAPAPLEIHLLQSHQAHPYCPSLFCRVCPVLPAGHKIGKLIIFDTNF